MPQVGLGDVRLKDGLPGGTGLLRDDFALRVAQGKAQLLPLPRVREPDLGLDARVLSVHDRRHGDARPAIAAKVKVRLRHANQSDAAVEPAVEREIRHLRIDRVARAVVNAHDDQRVALAPDGLRHLGAEGRIAAVVMADVLPVHIDVGGGVRALKLQIQPLRLQNVLTRELLDIVAQAAMVVVAAILAVDGVEGMRQVDEIGGRRHGLRHPGSIHRERPFTVQADRFSHAVPSFPFFGECASPLSRLRPRARLLACFAPRAGHSC